MSLLEIACFSPTSALIAQASGAHRIELCREQALGGVTPLLSDFLALRPQVRLPINVMIRPRGGNFVYTADELDAMEEDIGAFEEADGFVFGVLTADGMVDEEACDRLIWRAGGRPCTFHRAFDQVPFDIKVLQLEVLIRLGFRSVLTSGGESDAMEGRSYLRCLVDVGQGKIDVIVGGGVRSGNLEELKVTGATWYHSSAIVDGGELASGDEVMALRKGCGESAWVLVNGRV